MYYMYMFRWPILWPVFTLLCLKRRKKPPIFIFQLGNIVIWLMYYIKEQKKIVGFWTVPYGANPPYFKIKFSTIFHFFALKTPIFGGSTPQKKFNRKYVLNDIFSPSHLSEGRTCTYLGAYQGIRKTTVFCLKMALTAL